MLSRWLIALGVALGSVVACGNEIQDVGEEDHRHGPDDYDRLMAVPRISVEELEKAFSDDDPPVLVDVRTSAEYQRGHIPQAVNIPLSQIRFRWREVASGRPVVTYCS